jgi:hypothetical protein
MPSIKQESRDLLDQSIDELAQTITALSIKDGESETAYAGLLNYTCTRLAMAIIDLRFGKIRYGTLATVTGVFKNIADEFYRRIAVPYEDKQIRKSGDVDLYEKYVTQIDKS